MKKIYIKSNLKNIQENNDTFTECIGELIDNKIKYKENDMDVTISILNNKIIIERENNEHKISLYFDESKSYSLIYLKNENMNFELNIDLKKLEIDKNRININYDIECEYLFTLEYNVEE